MTSKRIGHKKSRNGCARCKARRVKCDENVPCSNCVRHNVECGLIASVSSPRSTSTPSAPTHIASPLVSRRSAQVVEQHSPPAAEAETEPTCPTPRQIQAPPSTVDLENSNLLFGPGWLQSLRLFHYYTTVVCSTLSMEPSTLDLWKVRVPELACSYEYLMHGLLAISALHYSQAHPEDRREYSIISTQYQNLAINYFATRLGDINETNCEPYFLLATMIFVLTNCSINNTHGRDSPVTAAEVAQTFMMLQGIKTILDFKPLQRWNQGGPLAPLLDEPSELQIPDRDTAFTARLDGLIALTRELNPSFDVISARSSCVLALESLRSTYCACTDPQARRRGRYMWLWPMTLPQKFIELISASSPIALIILAHYAALVNSYEHRTWVTRGLGASFMSMVERALEPPWHKHIVWPKRCVLEERHVDDKWEENDIMETSPV